MRERPVVALVALVCAAASTAAAAPAPLTLTAAQAEAREHAPERDAAEARVSGARDVAAVAGRWVADPVASAEYHADADRAWSVGLEWTLPLSGASRARGAAAAAELRAAARARDAALAELDAEVALAFADLADAQRRLARADRLIRLHELAVDVAERQLKAGNGTRLDVDAAGLDLRAARVARADAGGDLASARVRLGRLLGRTATDELAVADTLDLAAAPGDIELAARIAADPRVRAAQADLDAARATATAERRAARPDVTFGVDVGRARNQVPAGAFASDPDLDAAWSDWEVSFQLSLPLPLFDRNRRARADARARVLDAEAALALARADVRAEIELARAQLAAAIEAVEAAADVPQIVEREIDLLDKALRAGALDLADWSQQARRLEEVGGVYDQAVLSLRRARAAWARSASTGAATVR